MKADDCPSGSAGNAASVRTFPTAVRRAGVCLSWRSAATPLVQRLSHIFMDTQLLIIAFLRIRTLDKLFEATIALVNFRICN